MSKITASGKRKVVRSDTSSLKMSGMPVPEVPAKRKPQHATTNYRTLDTGKFNALKFFKSQELEWGIMENVESQIARELSRRGFIAATAAAGFAAFMPADAFASGFQEAAKVSGTVSALFMKQAGYSDTDIGNMTAHFKKIYPNVTVKTEFVAYEALHDKIVASALAHTYDVVLCDVTQVAEFGSKKIIEDVSSRWPKTWSNDMSGGAITTATYKNHFYGIPWILDTKYFFYNNDHLKKAKVDVASMGTWDGVMKSAAAIKKAGIVKYPLAWSWTQSESMICDYIQLLGAFDGQFLDASGKPAFNKGGGVQALEFMRKSIVDGLTDPTSTTIAEDDVRKVFSAGQISMGLNWTYMWGMANDPKQSKVAGKIAVAQTPAGSGGKRPGVNGSMALAMSSGSKNKEAAWEYMSFLCSQKEQNATAVSSLPVWKSSYSDSAVIKTNPEMVAAAKEELNDMILRPQIVQYNAVSLIVQAEASKALIGQKTPQKALDDAAAKAATILKV